MLVVAVRRSGFGRRLLAIRDSEAACATFGLNLVGTRLAVFTLSAGIAGLGGAIYAIQLNSVNPTRFDVVVGLPILMLVLVAGAGFVRCAALPAAEGCRRARACPRVGGDHVPLDPRAGRRHRPRSRPRPGTGPCPDLRCAASACASAATWRSTMRQSRPTGGESPG